MNKPYAIFDMDGTLVDSMGFWKRLAFEYLESHGVKKVSAEILERIKAMTMTESAALFISEYGLWGTPESVAADMNTMMDEHYRNDIPLKPGVKEYLTKIKGNGSPYGAWHQPQRTAHESLSGIVLMFLLILNFCSPARL